MIPPTMQHTLASVPGLKRGRSGAKESSRVLPIEDAIVEKPLSHLPAVVADMVRLQQLTGMQPAEIRIIRPLDLDRDHDVWIYRPSIHKTQHAEKDRLSI